MFSLSSTRNPSKACQEEQLHNMYHCMGIGSCLGMFVFVGVSSGDDSGASRPLLILELAYHYFRVSVSKRYPLAALATTGIYLLMHETQIQCGNPESRTPNRLLLSAGWGRSLHHVI